MELFGIGPLELVFIILLAIIIFGPKDIANSSKTVGKSLNKFIRSDTWKTINQTSRELKNLPNRLMREAGLDELEKSAREEMAKVETAINTLPGPTIASPEMPQAPVQKPDETADPDPSIKPPEEDSSG
jgi:sec-independent protein translocase protein TatB